MKIILVSADLTYAFVMNPEASESLKTDVDSAVALAAASLVEHVVRLYFPFMNSILQFLLQRYTKYVKYKTLRSIIWTKSSSSSIF